MVELSSQEVQRGLSVKARLCSGLTPVGWATGVNPIRPACGDGTAIGDVGSWPQLGHRVIDLVLPNVHSAKCFPELKSEPSEVQMKRPIDENRTHILALRGRWNGLGQLHRIAAEGPALPISGVPWLPNSRIKPFADSGFRRLRRLLFGCAPSQPARVHVRARAGW